LTLTGCGAGSGGTSTQPQTEAAQSDIAIGQVTPGVTPFIASVYLTGKSTALLTQVTYTIQPRPNSVAKPLQVNWDITALANRGYIGLNLIKFPVAGLYQNYNNSVSYLLTFKDSSVQTLQGSIQTEAYADPTGDYLNPTIVQPLSSATSLGYSYMLLKSLLDSPVIVDTDAQLRWVIPNVRPSEAVYFIEGQFIIGNGGVSQVQLVDLDGSQSALPVNLPQPLLGSFTHNIDPGPNGLLAEFNGIDDLGISLDDIVSEIAPFSGAAPYQTFDMADIISSYMNANGDNGSEFVRPGVDWFHLNATTYDASDNTVIISGREDFLIKVNYEPPHEIVWILGDPTKYWYTFPSLRAKALTLTSGGLYPVGQHGVSITSDGYVMIFNDGEGSVNQPPGAPEGVYRSYSAVSAYSIDKASMTATEVWDFSYNESLLSEICGSVYEAPGKTYLVDYTATDNGASTHLVGLDANHNVAFDFKYKSTPPCDAAWNSIPIPMENMTINQ
jgi:hypothetical protein